jgi:sugar fermentation stimulation protein A
LTEKILARQLLLSLRNYEIVERELLVRAGLRIDFLLSGPEGFCFLEVKSATIAENGVARFPDSITPRGLKHLECLTLKAVEGHRAVLLFVVQRDDVEAFKVSSHCYPSYAKAFQKALAAGVEILACVVRVSPAGFGRPRLLQMLRVAGDSAATGAEAQECERGLKENELAYLFPT